MIRLRKSLPCDGQAVARRHYVEDPKWAPFIARIARMLPDSTEDLFPAASRYASCAIVGNHGNLLHSKYGAQIDQHQVVIRFNRVRMP